jgi:hypothetical protein
MGTRAETVHVPDQEYDEGGEEVMQGPREGRGGPPEAGETSYKVSGVRGQRGAESSKRTRQNHGRALEAVILRNILGERS